MRIKASFAAAVVAVAVLGATASAASASSAWAGSTADTEADLLHIFATSDGEPFGDMTCHAIGLSYGVHHGQHWWHRWRCNGFDDLDRHIWLRVTATGPGHRGYRVIQSGCNDSESDYYC